MAGVGPFAVPLAVKGCSVYANDLNPHCYKCLSANAQRHCSSCFRSFNLDGRAFVKLMAQQQQQQLIEHQQRQQQQQQQQQQHQQQQQRQQQQEQEQQQNKPLQQQQQQQEPVEEDDVPELHVIMNLPAIAVEQFVCCLQNVFQPNAILPTVHAYCFSQVQTQLKHECECDCVVHVSMILSVNVIMVVIVSVHVIVVL